MTTRKTNKNLKTNKVDAEIISTEGATIDFLPAPEELAKYEKVVPGGAERILEVAEKQSLHRREMEEKSIAAEIRTIRIRQAMTFGLALVAGILGGALLLNGSELAGLIVILVDAAALVGVVMYGN